MMMDAKTYRLLEKYMLDCMRDSAHDREHVYRVLYAALDIAAHEEGVDCDVLIAACLLHDIGRRAQIERRVNHAKAGAKMAYKFLIAQGFGEAFACAVRDCVRTHRFRSDDPPQSIEAKILFDADKVDVSGALGVARTLLYQGETGEMLYTRRDDGALSDGTGDERPSFFREYQKKLAGIHERLFTARGREIAGARRHAARAFYESLLQEVRDACEGGQALLARHVR